MKCAKCNGEIQQGAAFCSHCGAAIEDREPIKKVSLKCEQCNGILTVDSDKTVLACPYCGHQSLIIENDAVTIERIKTSAHKEIEMEKIKSSDRLHQMENEIEQRKEEKEQIEKFKKSKWGKFLIIAFLISAVFTYIYFSSACILAGALSIVQAVCFGSAWCMGMNIIKEKKKYIHILVAIGGLLLIIPVMRSCALNNNDENVADINWNIIFMGDKIPEPDSKKIDILENTETKLWVDVMKVSDESYYEYVSDCKEMGYIVEMEEDSIGYSAYNKEGYFLDISHYASLEEMRILLEIPTEAADLEWDNHTISSVLPEPKSKNGAYLCENDEEVEVIISNTSSADYDEYLNTCIECGFDIDAEKKENSYESYDGNGNRIYLSYESGNSEMTVRLHFPMDFNDITWPTVGVGTLAPLPKSLSGKVVSDYGWAYSVYIENTTREEYEKYVQECIDAGFDNDVSNYGDSVWADYSDDININVEYKGLDIMYVSVTGSLNEDYSALTRKSEKNKIKKAKTNDESDAPEEQGEVSNSASAEESGITEEIEKSKEVEAVDKTEATAVSSSEYEKAYIRELSNYTLYLMFDENAKKVVGFGTNDTYVMKGIYTGNFDSGVTISWEDGWDENFVHMSGKAPVLTDGNGLDWDYEVCEVGDAQDILDGLN